MVLINGIKYACERCIRGHRVTTCNHTDQPLMMIKPKGRPSTTCDHCKELRKNKNANPSGVCTCGRLEKKRLAQKAKEEARAKAREEKRLKDCRCATDEPCKCHSTRRSVRKKNSITGSLRKDNDDDHLISPVSIDSKNSVLPENSLRDQEINGKVTKDYHNIPSLHSMSSFHSTQSLENSFTIPQSPPINGSHYTFNNNGASQSQPPGSSGLNRASSFINWDNSSVASSETNFNAQLQSDKNISVGLDPLQNTKKISPLTRTRVGEVTIPLEEYIPSNIDGVGKINDTNSLMQDWSFEGALKDTDTNPGYTNGSTAMNNKNASSGLLDMFLDSSSIPALSRANLLLQEKNTSSHSDINTTDYNRGNVPDTVKKTNSFHSSQEPFHHYNVKNTYNNNNSVIPKSNSNFNNNFNNANANKGSTWISSPGIDKSEDTSADNESVRSVEVLSLTPSFMDIPERSSSSQNMYFPQQQQQPHMQRHSSGPQRIKQRSTSVHRNHRYPSSSYLSQSSYNIRSQPITINPSMVSNADDTTSLSSLQSPTNSLIENGFLNSSTDSQTSKQFQDTFRSPRSSVVGENVLDSKQVRQPNQMQQQAVPYALQTRLSQQSQLQQRGKDQVQNSQLLKNLGISLDSDQFLGLSTADQNNCGSFLKSTSKENENPGTSNFANTMLKSEASPASSNQTASPPSQLLNEKSFADLDNFMSIL